LGIWKSSSRLQYDRLNPHVISLGNDCALIFGGIQINHVRNQKKLIRSVEIIDTKTKRSYFPKSGFKIPEEVDEVVGIFRVSQDIETAEILNPDPYNKKNHDNIEYRISALDESQANITLDNIDAQEDAFQTQIRVLTEKILVVFIDKRANLRSLFLDCESIIDDG
jgi:hypothetical protein